MQSVVCGRLVYSVGGRLCAGVWYVIRRLCGVGWSDVVCLQWVGVYSVGVQSAGVQSVGVCSRLRAVDWRAVVLRVIRWCVVGWCVVDWYAVVVWSRLACNS